jgi:hypothetical protein
MLDLFAEFGALVAHRGTCSNREATLIGCLMVSMAGMGICSSALQIQKNWRVHPKGDA